MKPRSPSTALVVSPFESFESAAYAVIDAKRSENTRKAYRADLKRWIGFCAEGSINPHTPSITDATMFRAHLTATRAEDSARRCIAALSSIYKLLLAGRVANANPFHPAVLAWPVANTVPRTQLVSDATATAMIKHAEQDRGPAGARDAAILTLLYDTGLRRESVATLLRANYKRPALLTTVKGGGQGDIDLPASSIAALDRWLRAAPASGYMFPGQRAGEHIHVATINKLVAQRAAAIGAEHVHPHCFRAAFVTAGYDAELPEYEIQAGVHHKDSKTTRRYDRGARGSSTATKIAKFRGRNQ